MSITLAPLAELHFSLLLKWLETPHVKAWWDQDIKWTLKLIQQKYGDYIKGYKLENGIAKTINAYIICADNQPVGYIQAYNAYDFSRSKQLKDFPEKLAAFDIFIGEEGYLKRGIGSSAITQFLEEYCDSYTHAFADPESSNVAAIHAYEKAGFKRLAEQPNANEVWMLWENSAVIIKALELSLLEQSVRQSTDKLSRLIADDFVEFGSSGKNYTKKEILEFLPLEPTKSFMAHNFNVKRLSKDIMLATYKTTEDGATSLRSSIWKQYGDGWQMVFHQGTKIMEN